MASDTAISIRRFMKVKQTYWDVYSCYEGVNFRQSLSTYIHKHRHLLSLVAIRQKLRALYLKSNVPSRLHLGFHWRDFHENSRLVLHAKSLQGKRIGCDQSIIKGALLEEQRTFSTISRLPREGFSRTFIPVTPKLIRYKQDTFGCDRLIIQ